MKAHFKTPTGRLVFELSADTVKEIFKQAAQVEDVFCEPCCAVCDSAYRFVVRTIDDNDFYELQCLNPACRAKLEFGQNKKGGGLFPRRKEGTKAGWFRFIPKGEITDGR